MASAAKYRDDTAGSLTTGGTSTAYTLTTNQVFASLTALDGMELSVKFNATNGAAPTLAVDGLTAKAINVSHATAVGTGVILANSVWGLTYNNSNNCFLLRAVPAKIQDSTVATASLADAAVTLAKMENRAANKLIGRYTASTGVPQEVTVSTGLSLDTSSGNLTAAFPPPSAFKNLSIKVASNTTVTVAADFVTTTDGTLYQTTALSGTINLGGNGAVNALDTGTIATDSWLFIWAIAKADGTTGGLASLSSTAPTMPTGYTFKARIGAVKTIHATATLYGTWQLGRRAQYVVGLAQTTTAVSIGTIQLALRYTAAHGQRRERSATSLRTVNRLRDFRNAVECQLDLCLRRGSKFILWNPDKHDKPAAHCSRQNIGRLLGQWEHYFRSGHHTGDCVSRNRDGVLHGMDG
jgi:hypothetical protein